MEYRVDVAEPALTDAEEYVCFIRDAHQEPDAAERWFRGLVEAIYSLEQSPERCPVIPEQAAFPFEVRHLIYFSHRIVYRIHPSNQRVVVYRIYHGAKRRLAPKHL